MRNLLMLIAIGVLIFGLMNVDSIRGFISGSTVPNITPQEAKAQLDKGIGILVDVRTREEYNAEHIENAILLPLGTIKQNAPRLIPDKDAVYFVYCRSGNRSASAVAELLEMGYTNVYNLGAIRDWPYEKIRN